MTHILILYRNQKINKLVYSYFILQKSRAMNKKKKPVIECIREFKLRQHYPSMIKKCKNVEKTMITNAQAKNDFHKIRLKLPSGKDLGECNVKILPNNDNILKNRIVTIINQNKCKNFNKSVILTSTMSPSKTKNLIGNISLRSTNSTVQRNVVSSDIMKNSIMERDNNVDYHSQSIPVKCDITNYEHYEEKRNRDIDSVDTDIITIEKCNEKERFEHNNIQRLLDNNKQSTNKNCCLGTTAGCSLLEVSDSLSFSRPVKMANVNLLVPLTKVPRYSINTSGAIAETAESNSNISNCDSQNDQRLDEKKQLYILSMGDRKINKCNFVQRTVNSICDKSIPQREKIITENAAMILQDNGTSLLNSGMITMDEINGKLIKERRHNICNDNTSIAAVTGCYENYKSQDVFPNVFQPNEDQQNIEHNIKKPSKTNYVNKNATLKRRCSSCSVLKEVMSIIHNKSLKAKALKAFADCSIEMEQQIPLDVKNTRTVLDTKAQTEAHSLLESANLLNVKKHTCNTVETVAKESYFASIPENLNEYPLDRMLLCKNSTFSSYNQLQESDTFLDKYIDGNVINDICNKHSTANKVKEVLSQPSVSSNKIFEQLQRDFETVRKWDENGMLNIHKAVISNRIYDIQRHLLVLKACNVNVDTPTQSGMTSLELAVKYNMSTEIVKLLLEAGANPASFQSIHNSALIIASKISSPLLPLLIDHVPSNELLDYVDFTGFAALHYCAQYGNLEGVNSLINMGANLNLQESRAGRTPLFLSIENDHPLIAEKLIENGAQADIPNFSGQTVMSFVEKIKHLSLVTLLHSMG